MDHVIARFHCDKKATYQNQWTDKQYAQTHLEFTAVNGSKPEDQIFYVSSPGGDIKLILSDKASEEVRAFFQAGEKYNVTFEKVEKDNGV